MLKLHYALPIAAVILGAFCWLFVWTPWVRALNTTSLTGTIADAQGNGVNGILTLQLPVPAQFNVNNAGCGGGTSQIVQNGVVTYALINGAIQNGPPVFDVACLSPANLFYIATVYDRAGNLLMRGNYVITGTAPFNIGTATPTTVTTSNISYANVGGSISTGQPNTWTAPQTFAQINSNTGSIAASGLIRLANSDVIAWRNGNNTADSQLGLSDSAVGGATTCTNAAPCLISGGATQTFAGTGSCPANQFANSLNAIALAMPGSPTCAQPNGANILNNSITVNSQTCTLGSSCSIEFVWSFLYTSCSINATCLMTANTYGSAHNLVRLTIAGINGGNIVTGCGTQPVFSVRDETASSIVNSVTLGNSTAYADSGGFSSAMTAGHKFSLSETTAGSGCTLVTNFVVNANIQ